MRRVLQPLLWWSSADRISSRYLLSLGLISTSGFDSGGRELVSELKRVLCSNWIFSQISNWDENQKKLGPVTQNSRSACSALGLVKTWHKSVSPVWLSEYMLKVIKLLVQSDISPHVFWCKKKKSKKRKKAGRWTLLNPACHTSSCVLVN